MPRLLFALLVAFSLSAAELPLADPQYTSGSTMWARRYPVVVGGDGFLVIWSEYLFDAYFSGWKARAYDADGNPLRPDATDIPSPHVVWTGEHYLVIDAAERTSRQSIPFPVPMMTAHLLHRDGTPAAPPRGYLEGTSGSELFSLFWDGTHAVALVSVEHKRLLRFDREGTLVSDTPVDEDVVAVAPNGDSLFFLRGAQRRVMAGDHGRYAVVSSSGMAIVDANGVVIDHVPIASRTLSWDGSAWHTAYIDEQERVCIATFTRSTDVRRECRTIADARDPAVGVIPRRTFVAWQGADKQIVTDSGIASLERVRQHAAASTVDATGLLVAWLERGIQLGGLRHDGSRRVQFFIPDTRAVDVELAANGDLSLIVWGISGGELYAMRLEANGAPLHPILHLGRGVYPRIVPSGDGWLVLRMENTRVFTTAISRDAVITGEHEVGPGRLGPDAAPTSDGFLVVTGRRLERLDRNGMPVGKGIAYETHAPRIACSAQACLVASSARVTLVDHHGHLLRELPAALLIDGAALEATALPDGSFRVYTATSIFSFAPDGTPRGSTPWNGAFVQWGGVETFRGRTFFFYRRDDVAYLRDLPPRSRAVRH